MEVNYMSNSAEFGLGSVSMEAMAQSVAAVEISGMHKNQGDTLTQTPEGLWGDDGNPHMPLEAQVLEAGIASYPNQQ